MRKVLVAEDMEDLREILALILKRAGYDPVICENGAVAWAYLRAGGPADMAVVDVVMPEMDGLELCQRIRSDSRLKRMPILLLTIKKRAEDQEEGYDTGADDYLPKPFREKILVARLRALERRLL